MAENIEKNFLSADSVSIESEEYYPEVSSAAAGVCVSYEVPQAEYMYGCTATVVGMLLGYYDYWGYLGYDASNLIDGKIELNSRGLDGNAHDMDAFDTVLGSAIASEEYVERFFNTDVDDEFYYTYKDENAVLNTDDWNCIADYIGTGQFWRGNGDLATSFYPTISLEELLTQNYGKSKISSNSISIYVPVQNISMLYGLNMYVEQAGYKLDTGHTRNMYVEGYKNGSFTFDDFCAEIDAGRLVMLHIEDHTMLAYGYDRETREVIFDDTYKHNCRMEWGGSYYYSNRNREMYAVTLVAFDTSSMSKIPAQPEQPTVALSENVWTKNNIIVTAQFDDISVLNEYSFDSRAWIKYSEPFEINVNKKIYFRSKDIYGNYSIVTVVEVNNIDRTAPVFSISGNAEVLTNQDVILTVNAQDSLSGIGKIEYSFDKKEWQTGFSVVVNENKYVYFRVSDNAGNIAEKSVYVNKIDKTAPGKPTVSANITVICNQDVYVSAFFSTDSYFKEYSYNTEDWFAYESALKFSANGSVCFRGRDIAGNISEMVLYTVDNIDKISPEIILSGDIENYLEETFLSAAADETADIYYSTDNLNWVQYSGKITVNVNGTYYFKAVDIAGNVGVNSITFDKMINTPAEILQNNSDGVKFKTVASEAGYIQYSGDAFNSVFSVEVKDGAVDTFGIPHGSWQWRFVSDRNNIILASGTFSAAVNNAPQHFQSVANGTADLFFGAAKDIWSGNYVAEYKGTFNGELRIAEKVKLAGKNKFIDIFDGSADRNCLILSDDDNGDAFFADDIFSASPVADARERFSAIDEIFSGAGDDIIDLTSPRFEVDFSDIKIYGGDGNDVIWANNQTSYIYGNAGNDRIIGGESQDFISGGDGDDIMHGGGGEDYFYFSGNFGNDVIEQYKDGGVTLVFDSKDVIFDEEQGIYTDGVNSVRICGTDDVRIGYETFDEFEHDRVFVFLNME